VSKHAPGAPVTIALHGGTSPTDPIDLVVENGPAPNPSGGSDLAASGGGYGVPGMRERAQALAGVSLTRPRPIDLAPLISARTLIVHGTDDALVLYERGCKIFETLAEITHPLSDATPDSFTILAPPTIANLYLSAEVSTFAATQANTVVSLDIALSHELPNAIAERRGHVGVMDGAVLHSGVASDLLFTTSGVCLLPKGHPLASKRVIQAADLDGLAYIAVYRRHPLRARLDRIFGEAQVAPRIVVETDLSTLACDFVCKGLGVSVLNPFPLLLNRRQGFVVRKFAPQLDFQTNLIVSANDLLPPPARRFVDILKSKRQAVLNEMKSLVAKE